MTAAQENAVQILRQQQSKVKERSPQWMAAEQIMDICRHEPDSAEIISVDLKNGFNITDAEKKIKAFADSHKTGNFACVIPVEVDRILREYFGLPERTDFQEHIMISAPVQNSTGVPDPNSVSKTVSNSNTETVSKPNPGGGIHINLDDFLN